MAGAQRGGLEPLLDPDVFLAEALAAMRRSLALQLLIVIVKDVLCSVCTVVYGGQTKSQSSQTFAKVLFTCARLYSLSVLHARTPLCDSSNCRCLISAAVPSFVS